MQCGTAAKGPQEMLGCWYNGWLSSEGDLQGTSVVFSDAFSDLTHARGTPAMHHMFPHQVPEPNSVSIPPREQTATSPSINPQCELSLAEGFDQNYLT